MPEPGTTPGGGRGSPARGEPLLRTTRLALAPFAPFDRATLLDLFRDADVRRYLLDGTRVSETWVDDEIRSSRARFAAGSAGLWTVRRFNEPAVIGFTGFREFFDPPELQLLYGFLPRCWGQGLATEAAAAACAYGFDRLGFSEIRAATDRPNVASARVLTRLGFVLDRVTDDGAEGTAFYVRPSPAVGTASAP